MNTTVRRTLAVLLPAVCACSNSAGPILTDDAIVGDWHVVTVNGSPPPVIVGLPAQVDVVVHGGTLSLRPDGTFRHLKQLGMPTSGARFDVEQTGTYELLPDQIVRLTASPTVVDDAQLVDGTLELRLGSGVLGYRR
jgi:hypothetical protein